MDMNLQTRRTALTAVIGTALICIAAWPAIAAGLSALHLDWHPSGDWALLAMRIEDVGQATPLLGPYSRFGWNHPGPLLYWALAAPYHLLGWSAPAMLAATAFLNAAALGGTVALAWRRGRLPLAALTTLALSILTSTMGPELLRDPWNPYITVLPTALLIVLCWSAAEGDRWAWPAAFAIGSFIVQSHIGYAVIVVAVGATAMVLAWRNRPEVAVVPAGDRQRRLLLAAISAVLIICWIPVLIDQFFGTGNLTEILRYFSDSADRPAGLHDALAQAADNLQVRDAGWHGVITTVGADGAVEGGRLSALLVPIALYATTLAAAVITGARSALRFQIITGVAVVSGILATSRITGPMFGYLIRWWWVLACLWWLSVVWSAISAVLASSRTPQLVRQILPVAVVGLCMIPAFGGARSSAHAADRALPPEASSSLLLHDLLPPLIGALGSLDDVDDVRVEMINSTWGTMADGVRYAISHAGDEVVVDPQYGFKFGEHRSAESRKADAVVWVVSADAVRIWSQLPTARTIAIWDPISGAERADYIVDEELLRGQLTSAGRPDLATALTNGGGGVDTGSVGLDGVDPELVRRVESIRRRGDPIGIFLTILGS
jgi:hypothetical protein